jgi:hypothetical protein
MSYFIKLTHTTSAKNRLQEAALKLAYSLDNLQLESPDALKRFAEDRIRWLNRTFNRCTALRVTLQTSYQGHGYQLYISDLVTLNIYAIKGQFMEEPAMSTCLTERVNCEAAGPQLGLFNEPFEGSHD